MKEKIRNGMGKGEWAVALALSLLAAALLAGEARSWTQCASYTASQPFGVPSTYCSSTMSKTTDCDADGIPDYYECYGLMDNTLRDQNNNLGVANRNFRFLGFKEKGNIPANYPSYPYSTSATDCTAFLNPVWRDLFVIVNRATGTDCVLKSTPIKNFLNVYSTNLKVVVHEVNEPNKVGTNERYVRTLPTLAGGQKAVRLTENLGTNPDFGSGNVGTPNAQDNATVWTKKIKDYVAGICDNVSNNCVDSWSSQGVGKEQITQHLLEYVISHEVAHMSRLTLVSTPEWGGNHRAPASTSAGTLMSQTIYVDRAAIPVKFYIPTTITGTTELTDSKLNGL